ncbi:uncharacterized protein G2W53_000496 [Senna tora]|uniref:Uncharacterized protein n=1 Tax=Senna tora TaxID=362788 RepID=A0A834XGM9_9FABA|nr:uncharacterized protein G2W53_000496 [Senna tora]
MNADRKTKNHKTQGGRQCRIHKTRIEEFQYSRSNNNTTTIRIRAGLEWFFASERTQASHVKKKNF